MLKQKKLKTTLILIIKISFNVNNNYVLYKKNWIYEYKYYKLQFYEYNYCKKTINKLKLWVHYEYK